MSDDDKSAEALHAELVELRRRVAELEPQSQRLREQQSVLLDLAASAAPQHADLDVAVQRITEASGEFLGVARTSVWLYNEERSAIRCLEHFDQRDGEHSGGQVIHRRDFPGYFEALAKERSIAAHDAHSDPRTCEFSDSYLTPYGISSLLDTPIWSGGRMLGVVCHEHVGPSRRWRPEELSFAGSISDLISLAIASHERRQAEQERHRLETEAKAQHDRKLESLGVLAGGIAHDFNNRLVGILANAELARDELPSGSSVHALLTDIEQAGRQAADLCNLLLAYSGKGRFRVGSLELDALVEQMAGSLEHKVSDKATIRRRLGSEHVLIEADAAQIRQIILGVVMNASDALGDDEGTIEITTGVVECDRAYLDGTVLGDGLREGSYAFVEVSDTGCGMDPQTVARIFDPFYTTKFTGRGLGLAAVLGIVRSHHGTVGIQSTPGQGTTFRMLFPRTQTPTQATSATVEPGARSSTGKVLLVDDDALVRSVGQRILRRDGFEVLTACDGVEGLEVFQEHRGQIACVLLDLTMPRMGGEQMFQELRSIDEHVPVVLCSGYSEQDIVGKFVGRGLADFVKKPYGRATLLTALRGAIFGAATPA